MYGQNQTHLSAGRIKENCLNRYSASYTGIAFSFQRYLFFRYRLQILKRRYTMTFFYQLEVQVLRVFRS